MLIEVADGEVDAKKSKVIKELMGAFKELEAALTQMQMDILTGDKKIQAGAIYVAGHFLAKINPLFESIYADIPNQLIVKEDGTLPAPKAKPKAKAKKSK